MRKNILSFKHISITIIGFIFFVACTKKNETKSKEIIITTEVVSNIKTSSASCGGNVVSNGGYLITNKGICWSANPNPSIANSYTDEGSGNSAFTSNLFSLTDSTTYYVRAYIKVSTGIVYGNEVSFTTKKFVIAIGEEYEGGIIFYIDNTKIHGIVAAPSNQGSYTWGCQGYLIGGTGSSVGYGSYNSSIINSGCQPFNGAARICYNLVLNGKNDWFLPSKNELNLIYQNLYLKNLGNLLSGMYWSSTEYNDINAWQQSFGSTTNQSIEAKDFAANNVRAVREF
jgi:hypothetical protein